MQDKCLMKGHLKVFTRKKGGVWEKRVDLDNLIVDLGLDLARDNVFGSQSFYVQWGAVSDNTVTPAAGDTSLGGNEVRNAFLKTDLTTSKQFYGEYYVAGTEWTGAGISNVSKAGLYYKATGSFLFNVAKFDQIAVDTSIEMLVQWTITLSG